jgi:hypothetical protein
MSFTIPTLTPSNTTLAQLKTLGVTGHVLAMINAQSPPLSPGSVALLRSAPTGNFENVYRTHAKLLANFLQGEPVSGSDLDIRLSDVATAYAILEAVANEQGALILANPGTIVQEPTGIGGSGPRRVWP